MDLPLLDWLARYTFAQEERFADPGYAKEAYGAFADELVRQGTLHACVFATVHGEATAILFDILAERGVAAFVGKVSMDTGGTPALTEDTAGSLRTAEELILRFRDHPAVKPILSPRFALTCSDALLDGLGALAARYGTPVQSHLAENREEVRLVKERGARSYADVYARHGLFGHTPTLMAHCIYLEDGELELMRGRDVTAVHCPDSNLNLSSGIMPARRMLRADVRVGLGTDVGSGHDLSMNGAMVRAVQCSKILKWSDPSADPLTFEEVFHMATAGNGAFFGPVGRFDPGCRLDALVVDDASLGGRGYGLAERLERFVYAGDGRNIVARYVNGRRLEREGAS
jgi:guanine deaminase